MSGIESDDDVTVDVDETLLDEIRAEAARRAAAQSEGDQDPVVQHGGFEVLGGGSATAGETVLAVGAGGFDQDVPGIEGYGALREIGRGGFSQVYEALQFEFERWVAIKVLNDAIERDEIAEFNRECRLMGVLSRHPNIVTVFESAFTDDHRPCIVMELFPHGSYLNILQSAGPLALEDLLPPHRADVGGAGHGSSPGDGPRRCEASQHILLRLRHASVGRFRACNADALWLGRF